LGHPVGLSYAPTRWGDCFHAKQQPIGRKIKTEDYNTKIRIKCRHKQLVTRYFRHYLSSWLTV